MLPKYSKINGSMHSYQSYMYVSLMRHMEVVTQNKGSSQSQYTLV